MTDLAEPREAAADDAAGTSAPDPRKAKAHVRRIVEHHLGGKPRRIAPLGGGLTNLVYEVNHTDGDFIVRLGTNAGKVKEYLKEQWAIARAREAGVPVAEVLEVGADLGPYPYMIARKVIGTEATHHPERLAILREMGRLTSRIHDITTTGFGHTFDWSQNRLSRKDTWRDYLHGELNVFPRLAVLEEHAMLDKPQMRRLQALWEEVERWERDPVLNHGDMRLKNVMVDEAGAVTAVIDWEFCSSNVAPYWDLSLALHDLSVDAKQEFLAGYGVSEAEVREMAPVMKAINVVNYAPFVERAAAEGDRARLEQYRTRLSGALDLYSF